MSDNELVKIDSGQFAKVDASLTAFGNGIFNVAEWVQSLKHAIDAQTADNGKWLSVLNDTLSAGLAEVTKAIREQHTPPPPAHMRGTIMADYSIPDDTPDGTFSLAVTASDSEGHPITDPALLAALVAEVINSDETGFAATLDATDNRKGTYHVGGPNDDGSPKQCTVTQNLKDADGNIIATGTDSFTVTTGKVALGSVTATFDGLTPIT